MTQIVSAEVIATARVEADRMLSGTAHLSPDTDVNMPLAAFRTIGHLLAKLADLAGTQAEAERFDAPVNGMRFWIPLPVHEAAQAELTALRQQQQGASMEDQLRRLMA